MTTDSNLQSLFDWRGNEYGVGDIIVYPTTQGSHLDMNEAVVREVVKQPTPWEGADAFELFLRVERIRSVNRIGLIKTHESTRGSGRFVKLSSLGRVTKVTT